MYPLGIKLDDSGMDISEIRLQNLRALASQEGTVAALARRMDMAYPLLNNYIGKTPTKRIGDKTARRAEEVFSLPRGWMDAQHEAAVSLTRTPEWPFETERARFEALPLSEKQRIGRFVRDTVEAWEATQAPEVRRAG